MVCAYVAALPVDISSYCRIFRHQAYSMPHANLLILLAFHTWHAIGYIICILASVAGLSGVGIAGTYTMLQGGILLTDQLAIYTSTEIPLIGFQ